MAVVAVIEPATTRALTTIESARLQLNLSPADVSDPQLSAWIGQISDAVQAYLNRTLVRERVREVIRGYAWRELVLERSPIVEVHSIGVNDQELATGTWDISNPKGAIVRLQSSGMPVYLELAAEQEGLSRRPYADTYTIDYTGGFAVGEAALEEGETHPLPLDIEGAVIDALRTFQTRRAMDPTVQTERLGDWSRTYATVGGSGDVSTRFLPGDVQAALAHYRRII